MCQWRRPETSGRPSGDLVIVIPGIMGSTLARVDGPRQTTVWDLSVDALPRLLWELVRGGTQLSSSASGDGEDGIKAVSLVQTPQWLPGFFGVDGYGDLLTELRIRLGSDRVLGFPYDWRLSVAHSAARLEVFAADALKIWIDASGNADAKLVLLCHSLGGLVARYFSEHLGGSQFVRSVVTIGTPHRGSMRALDAIVNGKRLGRTLELSGVVRSLTSVYELLPIFPCVEGAGRLLHLSEAGHVPNLDPRRLHSASVVLGAVRTPVEGRRRHGEPTPYDLVVFSNRRQTTPQCGRIDGDALTVFNHDVRWDHMGRRIEDSTRQGDGTVPWFAALPIEWDTDEQALALGTKHAAMHSHPSVVDTICNRLAPGDARSKKGLNQDEVVIELDVPAVVEQEGTRAADVTIEVRSDHSVKVEVQNLRTGERWFRPVRRERAEVVFAGLHADVYRVTARPQRLTHRVPAVSDYMLVIGANGP